MSASRKSVKKVFTVVWPINCVKKGQDLESPCFIAKPLNNTSWHLLLQHCTKETAGGTFFRPFLVRYIHCRLQDVVVALNYELLIIHEDKPLFFRNSQRDFKKGKNWIFAESSLSGFIVPEDIGNRYVTICCRMWKKDGELTESGHCLILSENVLYSGVEEISFGLKRLNIALGENQLYDSTTENIEILFNTTRTLQMDLEHFYNKQLMCDKKLRTLTRVFPAHSSILSARSPVFERMFASDMKEKSSDEVDIPDLEDDTVRRMLLFLYTDRVEDLSVESANKLYYVADKYEVEHLKSMCISYLCRNVSVCNVCELLLLADVHREENLKSTAIKFVLDHYKEVMRSEHWPSFMRDHIHISAEIMYLHALQ